MIKLQQEIKDGVSYIQMSGKLYEHKNDARGSRDKFWCENMAGSGDMDSNVLFKSALSHEHHGEVLYSELASQVGLDCVEYRLAEYTDAEGNKQQGTVCDSYLKDNEKTFSGYLITKYYKRLYFENNKGAYPEENLHTVDEYINMLQGLNEVDNRWLSEDKQSLTNFRNTLLKQVLFDFILAQTDRHWSNVEFIKNTKQPNQPISIPPSFDNGGCLFLNRPDTAINTYISDFKHHGYDAPSISARLSNYCPMMGIKTSLIEVAKGLPKISTTSDTEKKSAFIDELTDEILFNPEIATFYLLAKDKFNINAVKNKLEKQDDCLDENVYKMAEIVSNYQMSLIDNTIKKKLENIKEEDARELPYYKKYGYLGDLYGTTLDDRRNWTGLN